jgi:hypothetical protein
LACPKRRVPNLRRKKPPHRRRKSKLSWHRRLSPLNARKLRRLGNLLLVT